MTKKQSTRIMAMIVTFALLSTYLPCTTADESVLSLNTSTKITVIVDNWINEQNSNLGVEWGLSIYIETPSSQILFDTGATPTLLQDNADELNIDLASLDAVVISHEHLDHVGGLSYVAEVAPNVPVYIPPASEPALTDTFLSLGLSYHVVDDNEEIAEGVAIIQEIDYEQALTINVKGVGMIIVVGCSHPGPETITTQAYNDFNVTPYMIIGGFHLTGGGSALFESTATTLIDLDVQKIAPIHCSGTDFRNFMENTYSEYYVEAHVGYHIRFGGISGIYLWVGLSGGIVLLGITGFFVWRKFKSKKTTP